MNVLRAHFPLLPLHKSQSANTQAVSPPSLATSILFLGIHLVNTQLDQQVHRLLINQAAIFFTLHLFTIH